MKDKESSDYSQCICHSDWKNNTSLTTHRVPIDCETRSRKEVERDNKIDKVKKQKERFDRIHRQYKNWQEEFDDKWMSDVEVDGWHDWGYDGILSETIKKFIKKVLKKSKKIVKNA